MASIASANKGNSIVYTTDEMGSVTLKAVQHKNGQKECFIRQTLNSPEFVAYGVENFDVTVQLTKHQLQ
jgi:hypothetical protein